MKQVYLRERTPKTVDLTPEEKQAAWELEKKMLTAKIGPEATGK